MVSLPRDARLLFVGLWNAADDHGWLPNDSEQLRMQIFPGDHELDFDALLDLLIVCGRIGRYEDSEGDRTLRVEHWEDHQRVDRPTRSKLFRESSRKLAIKNDERKKVALKYGCAPGETKVAECYFCGSEGRIVWNRLSSGRPSFWITFSKLELEHFIPEDEGGEGVTANLVLACRHCNRTKATKDGIVFLRSILASPREPSRKVDRDQGNRDQGNGVVGETQTPERQRAELITEAQAVASASNACVPADFAKMVFRGWTMKDGRNGNGVKVRWAPYVKGRWDGPEGAQWKAGAHAEQKQLAAARGEDAPRGEFAKPMNKPPEPPPHVLAARAAQNGK